MFHKINDPTSLENWSMCLKENLLNAEQKNVQKSRETLIRQKENALDSWKELQHKAMFKGYLEHEWRKLNLEKKERNLYYLLSKQ
jgi:hypothetical protein